MIETKFETMLDQLEDELKGAEEYSKCAVLYKESMPEFYEHYLRMASTELEHANHLHNMIEKLLDRYDHLSNLDAIWDWQNERFMRWSNKIRTKMEMARK